MTDWRARALGPLRRAATRSPAGSHHPPPELSMDPRADDRQLPVEQSVIDAALYVEGRREQSPANLSDLFAQMRSNPASTAWIGLYRPSEAQLQSLAAEFGLHELAVEDSIVAHQRPKLERYGDTLFVVLRAARYDDADEEVDFSELHVFVGP